LKHLTRYLILAVAVGTVASFASSVVLPVLIHPSTYQRSDVYLDPVESVGWRISRTFGQTWIDIDPTPVVQPTRQGPSTVSYFHVSDAVAEKLFSRARIVNGGSRRLPSWAWDIHRRHVSGSDPMDPEVVIAQGWPFAAVWHGRKLTGTMQVAAYGWVPLTSTSARQFDPPLKEYGIPVLIIWQGLAGNWLVWTSLTFVLERSISLGRRCLRRFRGVCVECGYDLRHNQTMRCPECGTRCN